MTFDPTTFVGTSLGGAIGLVVIFFFIKSFIEQFIASRFQHISEIEKLASGLATRIALEKIDVYFQIWRFCCSIARRFKNDQMEDCRSICFALNELAEDSRPWISDNVEGALKSGVTVTLELVESRLSGVELASIPAPDFESVLTEIMSEIPKNRIEAVISNGFSQLGS